jgi:Skp family chaperone for outer membrane proteins
MRKLITTVVAVVGLMVVAAPLAAQAQAPTRIGYIDTRRVIQEAPGAVAARDTLSREMQAVQAELQAMDDSLRSMVAKLPAARAGDVGRSEAASGAAADAGA